MIGYAMLGTNNYEKALEFYDKVLAPVGGKRMMDFGVSTVFGSGGGAMLGIGKPHNREPATFGNGTMIALTVSEYHFGSFAQSESPHAFTARRQPSASR